MIFHGKYGAHTAFYLMGAEEGSSPGEEGDKGAGV
jgi:hypothetical protein